MNPRVIIADDDEEVRRSLADLLQGQGFEVAGTAAEGAEAVDLADAMQPDIVLMDLRMPGVDGIEATRRIRERSPTIQVVILSAYDDPGLRQGAAEVGVYCYLVKGSPPSLISDMLMRSFAHRRALEERAHPGTDPSRP